MSLTENLLSSLRLKQSFTQVDNQFVCSCILDINKIFSRNRGSRFHCVAVHQGCSILYLTPRQVIFLSHLFNSAGAEKQSAGSSSAHACATFMAGVMGTD